MSKQIERALQKINNDPYLWLKNFVKIRNSDNELVNFDLNYSQKDFVENRSRFNIILKTRQLGFSTLMLGMMLWSAHQKPGTDYLMVTDKSDNTQNLFNRLKDMHASMPEEFRVKAKRSNRSELLLVNGSRISVQTAGNREIGRGFSCELIHLSEFAFWSKEVQERALVSLEQALLKNEDAFLCIESTANGIGDHYYKIFNNAKRGHSKYKPFFYGWGSKAHRAMFKWEIQYAEELAIKENKGNRYVMGRGDFYPNEIEIYENYDVTIPQLLWRRYKVQDMGEHAFDQEFPINSDVAFVQSDTGFFNAEDIQQRYPFLPEPLAYNEIDMELTPTLQRYLGNGLEIFQPYSPKETYYGGVDTAAGVQGDNSTIVILDSSGEQVASFARNDIPMYKFADVVYDLGMAFNYAMFTIERNSYGLALIEKLRTEKMYLQILRFMKFDKISGRKRMEFGYYTDSVSKTKLLNDFKESFERGLILINCRRTLEEMKIYVATDGKLGNARGADRHDDLVDATALAVQALNSGKSYL